MSLHIRGYECMYIYYVEMNVCTQSMRRSVRGYECVYI